MKKSYSNNQKIEVLTKSNFFLNIAPLCLQKISLSVKKIDIFHLKSTLPE